MSNYCHKKIQKSGISNCIQSVLINPVGKSPNKTEGHEVNHQDIIQSQKVEIISSEVINKQGDNQKRVNSIMGRKNQPVKRQKLCSLKISPCTCLTESVAISIDTAKLDEIKEECYNVDNLDNALRMVNNSTQTAFVKIKPKAQVATTQTINNTSKDFSVNVNTPYGILTYDILCKNSIDFKALVGLSVDKFDSLCDFLDLTQIEQCHNINFPKLSVKEELLIVLVKIRRGYSFLEISYFAKMDITFLLVMFNKWFNFLYKQFFGVGVDVNMIDDKEVIQKLTKNLERTIYTYRASIVH